MSKPILYVLKYQTQKLCDILCVFYIVFKLVRNAVCTLACNADSRTCMNPDVEYTVFKIVFYEILNTLGIKFIIKTEFLQDSYTNLEFNT